MLTLRRCELRNGGGRGTFGFDMFDRLRSGLLAMPLWLSDDGDGHDH